MLRKLRIGSRLALGFGAIVVLMAAMAVATTLYGHASRDRLSALIEAANAKEALAADMKALLLQESTSMRNVGLQSEIKAMQADEDRAKLFARQYDDAYARMAALPLSGEERSIVEILGQADKRFEDPFQQALGLATAFHPEEAAQVIMKEIDPAVTKTLEQLDQLSALQKATNREAVRQARVTGDRVELVVYGAEALVLLLSVLMAWRVTRSITQPLAVAVSVTSRVASGDLTARIRVDGRDEAAALLGSLEKMNGGLGAMVSRIRSGAESIAVGASQVAAGNQELSSRTEEHASSLEETASTLEEFTTTVRQNADHAKQASVLAGSAAATAEKGGEVVSKVVTTMQDVTTSSKRISDIIGVIDGISFQTNILALNAAVEAARAGEQGRGFAVVASEVRNLAQRSAASAKEIRGLIEDSVSRVENGARLVEQAGKTMDELVASVKRVAEIMTEIAAASHEQSSGIEQINRAITQMDNVVQMNASLVEEATAAATSMAGHAEGLARAVAQFRLDEEAPPAPEAALRRSVPAAPARIETPAAGRPLLAAVEAPASAPVRVLAEDGWRSF